MPEDQMQAPFSPGPEGHRFETPRVREVPTYPPGPAKPRPGSCFASDSETGAEPSSEA